MRLKFVVTGGRGFIGSHFVEKVLEEGHKVIDIDKMTYCSNKSLPWDSDPNYSLIQKDLNDITHLPQCDFLVNFAAESHVDNSITSPAIFSQSNYNGVQNLLELIRAKVYDGPFLFKLVQMKYTETSVIICAQKKTPYTQVTRTLPAKLQPKC